MIDIGPLGATGRLGRIVCYVSGSAIMAMLFLALMGVPL